MKANLSITDLELTRQDLENIARQIKAGDPSNTRKVEVVAPTNLSAANESIRDALRSCVLLENRVLPDVVSYLHDRNNPSKYAMGAHARISLEFPPYPIRISPVETFEIPPTVSLVFPPGSELWLDELDGAAKDDVLFRVLNDDGRIASMRRDIRGPIIKCPELSVAAFVFEGNQCNLTVHHPVIYGCRSAFEIKGWHTDTRIYGGHIENCRNGVRGVGGHNCFIYENSFLTCETGIDLVNAQSSHIWGNVFSQENSVAKPDNPVAVFAQGKNILVFGNSIRDYKQCLMCSIYNGSFSDNTITFSPGVALQQGWFLKLQQWKSKVGGTNWNAEAGMVPSIVAQNNSVFRDDGQAVPQPGILFERGTVVHDIINRTHDGSWIKKMEVKL